MTEHSGKAAGAAGSPDLGHDLARDLDLFEFARAARQAAGQVRVSQLPRMANEVFDVQAEVPTEVPTEAPTQAGTPAKTPDAAFTWQAEGALQPELQDDGTQRAQPYLRLAVHGSAWLVCQRCLAPYKHAFDVDATFRIVGTEAEANEFPLDDDEIDVIVGSRHFDLLDLVEEELLLALPLVPKHDVCPAIHASLVSGVDGSGGIDSVDDLPEDESEGFADSEAGLTDAAKNPFAVLGQFRKNGSGEPH